MGTVYRETYTKPLPDGAELFTRKGERFARWTDRRGRKQIAKVTTGRDGSPRVVLECRTHTAKYRNGAGQRVKVATGCRSKDAAGSVLKELHDRADKVRCGAWTAAEDNVLDWQATLITEHVAAYLDYLWAKRGKGGRRVNAQHLANVEHRLKRAITECGFERLRDLNRSAMEKWADQREAEDMGARTLNGHLAALCAFGNWLVTEKRIVANPFARPPKRDEKANCRRARRALTEDELRRVLKVSRLRPLAEYGRKVVKLKGASDRENKSGRRTWTRALLEYADLDAATERGRNALAKRPDVINKLERRGRERALIYKTLVLTGLRKGELTALTVGNVELEGAVPYLILDAADEKAGRGAEIPLRADLADDLRRWVADVLADAQERARAEGKPIPARVASDAKLFNMPANMIRVFDRDLVAAGIARLVTDADGKQRIDKRDDRGRTIDVHALRHTFGTHLSKGGVAPRTAQAAMRHSVLELTMNTYTDPKLLDVAGALNVLPDLPLDDGPQAEHQKATGTDGRKLVPMLVPNAGSRCTTRTPADKSGVGGASAGAAVTSYADTSSARESSAERLRAQGLEPWTHGLKGRCSAD